jgi:ABC-2 type transport system ATP-binding protein
VKILQIDNLSKTYFHQGKKQKALDDVCLEVNKGDIYGLLGPNGAGKSTLINIISGIALKDSGKIYISGIDQDQNPDEVKFLLGVVPQEVAFDPFFTPRQVLDYYAGYYGIENSKKRTMEILEAVGLKQQADVGARKLSGGMRRRLLIAKALVHSPQLLILDEPTAGVDIELRDMLWEYVQKLNNMGTTIILTTHYIEEAERLCNKIGVISQGKIIKSEEKNKLLNLLGSKTIKIKIRNTNSETEELVYTYNNENELKKVLDNVSNSKSMIIDLETCEPKLEEVLRKLLKSNEL